MSQIARSVYGSGGFLYYALQIATMGILVLASNTSFNGLSAAGRGHGRARSSAPPVHEPG